MVAAFPVWSDAVIPPETPSPVSVFDLPPSRAAKAVPEAIAADEAHLRGIARSLAESAQRLSVRLADERRAPGGTGEEALNRDLEIHRLTARLRTLQRYGVDLCLGRMVPADGEPVYVGRLGLTDDDGRQLLVDWRSPVAEPFFGATHANPMGLVSRRRYHWSAGRITDYRDEVFDPDALTGPAAFAALDDQSAFVASLGAARSSRMRDVLGTIQADQDAIIRAGSRGALVVDGGPGTGKTVVALHRAAYLLYADPRLGHRRGGVLFVGPSRPYLDYVADVLPSLGEEGVRTCTLRDLQPEGATAPPEPDAEVARLKSSAELVHAVERAVAFYEEPPAAALLVETEWGDVRIEAHEWTEAFALPPSGVAHNDRRELVWDEVVNVLLAKFDDEVPPALARRALESHHELATTFNHAWPLLDAADVVGDLWSVPAFLRMCAPNLTPDEVRALQRREPQAWTIADLPVLDAARLRLGDPAAVRLRRQRRAAAVLEDERRERITADLVATDQSDLGIMSMLRGDDLRDALRDQGEDDRPDPLAGPFAHVLVDEAQELTDAEWQMLLARCPSQSFTVVGDRAQARDGFAETWQQRLRRVGVDHVRLASLTVNYRTPAEIMAAAEPIIRAALPGANVPTSIRSTGVPVRHASVAARDDVLADWLAAHPDGLACVIGDASFEPTRRVRSLTPALAKGLEFDLVVLVSPDGFGAGIAGAVDRYVAMTRATGELVVLE